MACSSRLLRRIVVGFAFLIAGGAAALILVALLLPSDGTKHILKLRSTFAGAQELAARRDERSSIRHIALRDDRGEILTTVWVRRPRALRSGYRILITYAGENTGHAILGLIPARDEWPPH